MNDYNTGRSKLAMPEYGRNILRMVENLRTIEDRAKRTEQAYAVIKVMETLNPAVHHHEDYEHKLWDQLYIISGFNLDVDSPYPCPSMEDLQSLPMTIPMKESKIKAPHYGRNIERIINLLCDEPDGEIKTEMIRSLAIYMRQQYLIWNKDSVSDETIFNDIEKLSDYRLNIPEGINLSKISSDASFARPGLGINSGQNGGNNKKRQYKNNKRQGRKK